VNDLVRMAEIAASYAGECSMDPTRQKQSLMVYTAELMRRETVAFRVRYYAKWYDEAVTEPGEDPT
jgi:hypothetical protein